ncbi:hypothetical protein, partial [Acinetobacter nosocomialis]|uniref:hypothetical protein n=1 Tax=Acinetobacter nosocomialis TaxID=106654 RepID=UPI0013D7C1FF
TERLADVVAPISEGQISFVSDPAKTFGKLDEYDTYRGQAFDQDTVVLEFVTSTATAAAICREVAVLYSIGVAETKAQ